MRKNLNVRRENGSITLFVLVGLLFMASISMLLYAFNLNKSKIVKEQFNIITDIYSHKDGDANAYERVFADLRRTTKKTIISSVQNASSLILDNTYSGYLNNYKIYGKSQGTNKIGLPLEYQQVEYLESTGTQYITTNIYPKFNWKYELKFSNFILGNTAQPPTFFSTEKSEQNYFYSLNQNTFNYTNVTDSFTFGITNSSNIDTIYFDGKTISYNDIEKKTYTPSTHTSIYKLLLFRNRLDGAERYASFKLYSFKIFDGDDIIYDLVPCYRISDKVKGLYDEVNGVFYTNAGTGEFIAGPEFEIDN